MSRSKEKKPVIEEIPKDRQEQTAKILDSRFGHSNQTKIRALGGQCLICGKAAQKIVKTDVSDANDDGKIFRIER